MKTKKNIPYPIRIKIFWVSLIPTVALLGAAMMNNQYLNVLGESAEQILSKNYRSIKASQEARKALEEIRNEILEMASRNRIPLNTIDQALHSLALNLRICHDNITEKGENELARQLMDAYTRYETLARSLTGPDTDLWMSDRFSSFLRLTAEMIADIDRLAEINEDAMERAEQNTRLIARKAQRHAFFLFAGIIIAILALNYFLSYRIAKPIISLASSLSDAKEGGGVYPQVQAASNDEIGFLAQAFNRLFSRLEEYDRGKDDIIAAEKEKVRRSEEAKRSFIADISHQLKTPMTSLSMSIGLLKNRGDRLDLDKQARLFAAAYEDCNRLAALITELVDMSRLETLSRPRPKERLDVSVLLPECLAPLRKQADDKGVSIVTDIEAHLSPISIDSFRFPWIITNLVGNALRYTERGGKITLQVYRKKDRVYFQCTDTGCGIDPQYLPHIFDRYSQFSERGKSGAIGLGLAIVKDIIEQHGGDISVKSRPGEGAVFTFWIPAVRKDQNEKSAGD